MKVVGLITEYNPFHLGHKYHLNMSKTLTNCDYSVAIMSGSFVQRGEPSFVDKWTKAKMAVDNGVDLVIELPFIFSAQSAEFFAYGGIALLDSLNIVDYFAFGSESNNINHLDEIAQLLIDEPPAFKKRLKECLDIGYSFPVSRSKALEAYYNEHNPDSKVNAKLDSILKMSNNILAIEYLKALKTLNSNIKPITFERIGSTYTDNYLSHKLASATSIRRGILNGSIENAKEYIPSPTYRHLVNYIKKYKNFNTLSNYSQIIHYIFMMNGKNNLADISDVEAGLENRIIRKGAFHKDVNDLVQEVSTKRYTKTRIQRILVHLMLNLTNSVFKDLSQNHPSYIRVLGTNRNGFKLINEIKKKSKLPIIIKFSDYKNYKNYYINQSISFDKNATDLFFLGLNNKLFKNMDYYTTPYIKND